MPNHALAFVNWNVFRRRSDERRPERSFFYASPKPQLIKRIGDGGTLWVITRRLDSKRYSLAFKLVNCRTWDDVPHYISNKYGNNLVVSENWDACEHYPYNDITEQLMRLRFKTGKPLSKCKNIGLKTLSIPQLQPSSVRILDSYALNLLSERVVFLSYSRKDLPLARKLVRELNNREIQVRWDEGHLTPGTEWKKVLETGVRASDVFAILVSDNSAESDWVRRELRWAKEEIGKGGCVERILPLRLPDEGWGKLVQLHEFQYMDITTHPKRSDYDRLCRMLIVLPRRRKAGWN
jgi:hypothetical protein